MLPFLASTYFCVCSLDLIEVGKKKREKVEVGEEKKKKKGQQQTCMYQILPCGIDELTFFLVPLSLSLFVFSV